MFEKWGDGQRESAGVHFSTLSSSAVWSGNGELRRIGQRKAINTLWNWCGSRKCRKRCKGKQHYIMYLLTFQCIALVFLSAIDFSLFFMSDYKPLTAQFGDDVTAFCGSHVCWRSVLISYFWQGTNEWTVGKCDTKRIEGHKYGPCSCLYNCRPGSEECLRDRWWWWLWQALLSPFLF